VHNFADVQKMILAVFLHTLKRKKIMRLILR